MSGALKAGGRALEEALWSDTNISVAVTAAGLRICSSNVPNVCSTNRVTNMQMCPSLEHPL